MCDWFRLSRPHFVLRNPVELNGLTHFAFDADDNETHSMSIIIEILSTVESLRYLHISYGFMDHNFDVDPWRNISIYFRERFKNLAILRIGTIHQMGRYDDEYYGMHCEDLYDYLKMTIQRELDIEVYERRFMTPYPPLADFWPSPNTCGPRESDLCELNKMASNMRS